MNFRFVGDTGIMVSELALGTLNFAECKNWNIRRAFTQKVINYITNFAIDNGINLFDTADVYGNGEAERRLGVALKESRSRVLIASKVNFRVGSGINQAGLSRYHIMNQVNNSLRRLNTDYLDFYFIHGIDNHTNIVDTISSLDELVKSGKVRYLGVSNLLAWQIVRFIENSKLLGKETLRCMQLHYSILDRGIEREFLSMQNEYKLGFFVWGGLSGGFLSGKYTDQLNKITQGRRVLNDFPPLNTENANKIIRELRIIANSNNITLAQLSLAWLLSKKSVSSVIIGINSKAQFLENLNSIQVTISEDQLKRIDGISKLEKEYPGWYINLPTDRY